VRGFGFDCTAGWKKSHRCWRVCPEGCEHRHSYPTCCLLKILFEYIALLLRIYPIISTSYQQLTHGLTNHLDLNCLSPTLALVLESDKQGHIEFYKYHIFSRSSSTKLPLSCSMISIRSAFVSNSTSDFWKMYSRSYFSSSSIGTGSKGFFASILWMY